MLTHSAPGSERRCGGAESVTIPGMGQNRNAYAFRSGIGAPVRRSGIGNDSGEWPEPECLRIPLRAGASGGGAESVTIPGSMVEMTA